MPKRQYALSFSVPCWRYLFWLLCSMGIGVMGQSAGLAEPLTILDRITPCVLEVPGDYAGQELTLDLGTLGSDMKAYFELRIAEKMEGEYIEALNTSCSCVQVDDADIDYREDGIMILPGHYSGRWTDQLIEHEKQSLEIHFNDRVLQVNICAEVLPTGSPRTISPMQTVDLGKLEGPLVLAAEIPPGSSLLRLETEPWFKNAVTSFTYDGVDGKLRCALDGAFLLKQIQAKVRHYPYEGALDYDVLFCDGEDTGKNGNVRAHLGIRYTGPILAEPASIDFGMIKPGEEVSRTVYITCQGKAGLHWDGTDVIHIERISSPLSERGSNKEIVKYAYRLWTMAPVEIADVKFDKHELVVNTDGGYSLRLPCYMTFLPINGE